MIDEEVMLGLDRPPDSDITSPVTPPPMTPQEGMEMITALLAGEAWRPPPPDELQPADA